MRIMIIQEAGRHKENAEFRESLNFQRAFGRLGVPCTVWGLGYPKFDDFKGVEKNSDILFLMENYELGWVPELSQIKKPKIFWSIDAHWNLAPQLETVEHQGIDHVLSSTFAYCKYFANQKRRCSWFPNAYPADLISVPAESKKLYDVGFCGNVVNRGDWLKSLSRSSIGFKFDKMVLGQAMVKAIQSYKIHWNRNISDDVNYRTGETLGCGTFLLTNDTDRLHDLFEIGKHLVTYTTLEDCLQKIDYYLRNEEEREAIAKAGHEHAEKWHTYDCRAKQLLNIIEQI